MREIAGRAEKKTPESMKTLYDEIVNGVGTCAQKGMMGMGITMDFPEEVRDYIPHIIGDLRGGGFVIDIIAYQPSKNGVMINFFVTW